MDYAFKRIFTADEKRSNIALKDFLNSVLEFEESKLITDLTVINPHIPVDIASRKKSIFDVRAQFNNGEQAIIEMQLYHEYDFKKRSQFIVSKAYTSQPIAGLDYDALKKCYLICIVVPSENRLGRAETANASTLFSAIDKADLKRNDYITNFELLPGKNSFINDFRFRDRDGEELTNDQTIIFMELPKIDKVLDKPVDELTGIEMWAFFYKYATDKSKRKTLNDIIDKKEGIGMAVNVLNEISRSEEERIQYENELIFDLDMRSGLKRAKIEGKIEGKIEIAKNLFDIGLTDEQIAKITGLSIEEIKNLKE